MPGPREHQSYRRRETTLTGHQQWVMSVAFSRTDPATATCDRTVHLWDVSQPAGPGGSEAQRPGLSHRSQPKGDHLPEKPGHQHHPHLSDHRDVPAEGNLSGSGRADLTEQPVRPPAKQWFRPIRPRFRPRLARRAGQGQKARSPCLWTVKTEASACCILHVGIVLGDPSLSGSPNHSERRHARARLAPQWENK